NHPSTTSTVTALHVALPICSMRAGEWDRESFNGIELHGKTLGLVGAGRIGGEVARRARAFGMRVVAYDPHVNEERARALNLELRSEEHTSELQSRENVVCRH